jgi:hypothetical protein
MSGIRRPAKWRELRAAKQGRAREAIGDLQPGLELFVLTFGQFSLIDVLVALLDSTGPADVDVSTWTAAHAHLEESRKLLDDKRIRRLRFLVDRSLLTRQPAYCARLRELFGDGCIRTNRSHCKFMTVRNERWTLAVRTSMNLNENPRLENLEVSDDPRLCAFLVTLVDDVFREHAEGEFTSGIPVLESLEAVRIPGQASGRKIERHLERPSTGRK